MTAYMLDSCGRTQTLRHGDWPEPSLGPDDALVGVTAAGLNLLDSELRRGELTPILPYETPFVLGHASASTVVQVGAGVQPFKHLEPVHGLPWDGRIGTLPERIAVKAADLASAPSSLSVVEVASIPLVVLTAWTVLVETAWVRPGQKVLIRAGSGGADKIAIQLVKHLVAVTTGADGRRAAKAFRVRLEERTRDRGRTVSTITFRRHFKTIEAWAGRRRGSWGISCCRSW